MTVILNNTTTAKTGRQLRSDNPRQSHATTQPTHLTVLVEDGEAVAGQEHGRETGAPPQLVRVRAGAARPPVHAAESQELVAPAVAVVGHLILIERVFTWDGCDRDYRDNKFRNGYSLGTDAIVVIVTKGSGTCVHKTHGSRYNIEKRGARGGVHGAARRPAFA